MQHLMVRLYGVILLFGAVFIAIRTRELPGYFSLIVLVGGVPTGVGMLLFRPWGRFLGLLFFLLCLAMAAVFLTVGRGFTLHNVALFVAALGGIVTVYRWD